MALNPALIADVAQALKTCACTALVEAGRVDEACCDPEGANMRAFIAQGEVAWDACCNPCGQLSVRLMRMFEVTTPPTQVIGGPDPCGNRRLIAEFEVLRLSCVKVASEDGSDVPTADQITLDGVGLLADVWVLWSGLRCCFEAWRTATDGPTRDWSGWMVDGGLAGPDGGCAGARVTVQVDVGPSCDCRPWTPPPIP